MPTALLAALALATPAHAVPTALSAQGRLLDEDGSPIEDTLDVTFRLVDAETSGTTLWEETHAVTFEAGFYTVTLGDDAGAAPLEDEILDQWPLWLEVQIDGEAAMSPRTPLSSVPYARLSGTANAVSGGAVDASSVSVGGAEVIDATGAWVGPTPAVGWGALTGVPSELADGDDDSLAALACSDGQWAIYDGTSAAWSCDGFSDTTRSDADLVATIEAGPVDLASGSSVDGYSILVDESAIEWDWLVSVPADLADGDDDTLGDLSCGDGELAVYDTAAAAWACGVDADTDTTLTAAEVVAAVEAAGSLALPAGTTAGGAAVITASSSIDWSQLSGLPSGLADGDDDTLGALSCTAGQVPVYPASGTVWTCGDDTDTTLTAAEVVGALEAATAVDLGGTLAVGGLAVLTEGSSLDWSKLTGLPAGLADGDDDTLAALSCSDGEVAAWDASSSAWGCASSGGGGGAVATVITTRCAWTATSAANTSSCTPPSCPTGWSNLGVTGNAKTGVATWGATTSNTSYSKSTGYSERSCTSGTDYAVLVTRCAWTGTSAAATSSCTPPSCPSGWTNLGTTGNVNHGAATYGATTTNTSYSKSGGHSERTCVN
jgi:hypothetical protein